MSEIPTLTFESGGWCQALGRSYRPGRHRPATLEEYNALAPFAVNAAPVPVPLPETEAETEATPEASPVTGPTPPLSGPRPNRRAQR
jgi:hypothetical protein